MKFSGECFFQKNKRIEKFVYCHMITNYIHLRDDLSFDKDIVTLLKQTEQYKNMIDSDRGYHIYFEGTAKYDESYSLDRINEIRMTVELTYINFQNLDTL